MEKSSEQLQEDINSSNRPSARRPSSSDRTRRHRIDSRAKPRLSSFYRSIDALFPRTPSIRSWFLWIYSPSPDSGVPRRVGGEDSFGRGREAVRGVEGYRLRGSFLFSVAGNCPGWREGYTWSPRTRLSFAIFLHSHGLSPRKVSSRE